MKKYIWLILSVFNALASSLYISRLPDGEYPLHYGLDYTPNRYGSKSELMILTLVPVIISVIFIIYRIATKNNANVQKNAKYENVVIPVIIVVYMILMWFMLMSVSEGFNVVIFTPTVLLSLLGLLMIIIANYMGKTKQNRYFGIRTKATLSNETVWRKAHRLCGKLGTIGGVLMVAGGIACVFIEGTLSSVISFACLLIAICLFGVIPSIYASKLYKELGCDSAEQDS